MHKIQLQVIDTLIDVYMIQNEDNTISIMNEHNQLLSAHDDLKHVYWTDVNGDISDYINEWEKFEIDEYQHNKILKSWHGRWLWWVPKSIICDDGQSEGYMWQSYEKDVSVSIMI